MHGTPIATDRKCFPPRSEACVISEDGDAVAAVMGEILAYLGTHPLASDTAEGIVQWWLPHGSVAPQPREVNEALERLAAAGLIRAEALPGGAVVYGGIDGD